MKGLPFIVAVFLATTGCASMSEPQSEEWHQAEQSLRREEWQATNGMAWPSEVKPPELVMTEGMEITAQTANGEVHVRAGADLARFYTWNGQTRSAKLWPRKQRWYGSLGLYYPGPGEHWKSNNGITRGVLGEGVLWFRTVEDALCWIESARLTVLDYVFTDDGLLIGFGKTPARKQLNVEVWQIMIAGEKPRALPRSRNDLITVSNAR